MQIKSEKVRELVRAGKIAEALRIAKGFKMGFTKDEKRAIEIAHECNTGKESFYQNLKIDTVSIRTQAEMLLIQKYS